MTLIKKNLEINLSKIIVSDYPGFIKFPDTSKEAALNFITAINSYVSTITPPSTGGQLGIGAFMTIMNVVSNKPGFTFIDLFSSALKSYAVQIGLGMFTSGFTGVAPVTQIDLNVAWKIGNSGGTALQVVKSLSALIDTWFRTGIATNISTGATIPWS